MPKTSILERIFYEKDPALVMKNLLGKTLVKKVNSKILLVRIVETEAYRVRSTAAFKAYKGKK